MVLVGCDSAYYNKSYSFSNEQWTYDDPINFDFEILDTTKVYDMFLTIDHEDKFPYQNLYLKTATSFPDLTKTEQLLSLELANEAGFWFGECNGSNCELQIEIQSRVHFSQIGNHQLSLQQYTRTDTLSGIGGISLTLAIVE